MISRNDFGRAVESAMEKLRQETEELKLQLKQPHALRDVDLYPPYIQDEIGQRRKPSSRVDREDQAPKRFLYPELRSLEGKRRSPFCRRGRKLELPMRINNRAVVAMTDTGSDINAITEDLAEELGATVHRRLEHRAAIKIANGRKVQPCGRTVLSCSFLQGFQMMLQQSFFVFQRIAPEVSVIMGRKFLNETKTLSHHRDRLRERSSKAMAKRRVLQMKMPKARLACYLDASLVLACADTGSEVDLMSRGYAERRRFDIAKVAEHEKYIVLATEEVAALSGKVRVRFDTFKDVPFDIEPSAMNSDRDALNTLSRQHIRHLSVPDHDRTFYILDDLNCDVLLGEDLLDSIDAFTKHADSFFEIPECLVETSNLDLNIVKWANHFERWYGETFSRPTGTRLQPADRRLGTSIVSLTRVKADLFIT